LSHLWQLRVQQRIPLQYLLERVHWRHFSLRVAPGVLIPRPETELLIDMVVALLAEEVASATAASTPSGLPSHWVDLGTGSGVIALGLADALPTATTHAVDCSTAALVIARDNAQQLGLGDRIQFYHGHWWEPLSALRGQCQGMVANPPYIPSSQIAQLQPEVAWHEPHLALDGGADGLDCVRHLVTTAPEYLKSGGIWLVEVMAGQAPAVVELLRSQGSYRATQIHQDWAGIERFVSARVI
jgi:release factor glutamine methyltransferase